jgi:outer membrane protein assembly factor BamD (BamD/ComL family)
MLAALVCVTGCTALQSKPKGPPPATPEQLAWWEGNRERAKYMAGRGWYVEGVNGFFDDQGRPMEGQWSAEGTGNGTETETILDRYAPNKFPKYMRRVMGRGPDESVARAAYEEGERLFREKEYKEAIKAFHVAGDRWPDSPLEEDALFKMAESYFFSDYYMKAEDTYARLIKKYPSTQYLDQIMPRRFAIARFWEQCDLAHHHWMLTPNFFDKKRPRFDTPGHAIRVYDRIRLDDPVGPLADDALMATANAHFLHGRYDDADYHYGLIRSEYPKSEHQLNAHLLGLRTKMLKYQGPGYDAKPLKEADDLIGQLQTQFPTELGQERERLVQERAKIRASQAMREYDLAEYYRRTKYNGAARVHYENVATEFPDTKLAEQSKTKVEEIKDLPEAPEPVLGWFVNLFPESKKDGPVLPKAISTGGKSAANVASRPNSTPPDTTQR